MIVQFNSERASRSIEADRLRSIFMTTRERAQERNAKLMDELQDLNEVLKKPMMDRKISKSEFNKIKVFKKILSHIFEAF